jgi:hypothetical protein
MIKKTPKKIIGFPADWGKNASPKGPRSFFPLFALAKQDPMVHFSGVFSSLKKTKIA